MSKSKIAQLKFYANIGGWGVDAAAFTEQFESMASKYDEVLIRVHSYGGSVFEGNVMYNALLNADIKTIIQIDGIAASMMGLVMFGADEIRIADNGFVMVHCPKSSIGGNAAQHENEAKLLRNIQDNSIKRISEKTGKSVKDVSKLFDGNDHWFSAQEALEYGLVDKVIPATVKNVKNLDVAMVESLGAESIYNRFAAQLNFSNHHKNSKPMKKLLIDLYKLESVTEDSSDAEVLAAIQAHSTKQDQRIRDLETAQANAVKEQIERMITTAEEAKGKAFDDKQKAVFVQIGEKAGIEPLQMALGLTGEALSKRPEVPNIVSMISGKGSGKATPVPDDRTSWDWEKWQKEDPRGLERLQETDPSKFDDLYKAEYER